MGNRIAHVFTCLAIRSPWLYDISEEALKRALPWLKNLNRRQGGNKTEVKQKALTNINCNHTIPRPSRCWAGGETATENVDLKLKIFRDMDDARGSTILTTNIIHFDYQNCIRYQTSWQDWLACTSWTGDRHETGRSEFAAIARAMKPHKPSCNSHAGWKSTCWSERFTAGRQPHFDTDDPMRPSARSMKAWLAFRRNWHGDEAGMAHPHGNFAACRLRGLGCFASGILKCAARWFLVILNMPHARSSKHGASRP